jgi:hypothetical protein
LQGDWRSEHLFVLRLSWENWRQVQQQIQKCDQELWDYTRQLEAVTVITQPGKIVSLNPQPGSLMPLAEPKKSRKKTSKNQPAGPWRAELQRFFGVDLTLIPGVSVLTAITLMSELGNDLRAFKTAQHFSSWLCLCPDNDTSARKVLRRSTRRSQNRLRQALRVAASTLHHEKAIWETDTGACAQKLGAPKAITAMAHKLARIIWHLLTHQVPFDLSIFAAQEKAHQSRRLKSLSSAARQMGFKLTPLAA